MPYTFHREWLSKKFQEIETRLIKAIEKLDDAHLNWQPAPGGNSISILLRHMEGSLRERIGRNMCHREFERDRDREFINQPLNQAEAKQLISTLSREITELLRNADDTLFEATQTVRGKERSNLDMLHQCAAHYSEHMGQVFYIAKLCLQEQYKSTSV